MDGSEIEWLKGPGAVDARRVEVVAHVDHQVGVVGRGPGQRYAPVLIAGAQRISSALTNS